MKFRAPIIILLWMALLSLTNTACKKDKFLTTGGDLKFSLDTLSFDTVFTTLGSFTAQVKIYNPQNQKITISSVRLEGTNASFFHLNVNGVQGNEVKNIEVAAKDSIYVFATVKVDPNGSNNPFVVEANIKATLNGKDFSLPLLAYGQDAHYIYGDSIGVNTTWLTDKPYVIIHSVLVGPSATLTIPSKCRIYLHADSRIYVDGTMHVDGTKQDSVVFQGDRLDRAYFGYEGYPGEWGGIYYSPKSHDNYLKYAILKNCGGSTGYGLPAAIWATPDTINDGQYQLRLYNTIIENSIGYGILSFSSTIRAENCLINTCGAQALATFEGGQYDFLHCDLVTYGTTKVSHTNEPTVALINYRDISDVQYVAGPLVANFTNCVVWGSLDNEFFANKRSGADYTVTMNNCLLKSKDTIPSYVTLNSCIINQDPMFNDYTKWDYHPKTGSPLIDKGATTSINTDLDDKGRVGTPDIGCYEFQ